MNLGEIIKNPAKVSKAIGGGIAAAISAPSLMVVSIPEGVVVPWWGYVLAGAVNAAFVFTTIYFAPRNAE